MTSTEAKPPAPAEPATRVMRRAAVPDLPDNLPMPRFEGPEAELRRAAWEAFTAAGLPRTGDEDYSFVSVTELRQWLSAPSDPAISSQWAWEDGPAWERFESGSLFPPLLKSWIEAAASESDAAAALALAWASPAGWNLPAGREAGEATLTLKTGTGRTDTAHYFRLGDNASARIRLRSQAGEGFLNAGLIFHLGPGSRLELAAEDFDVSGAVKLRFILEKDARLTLFSASTGSRWQRLALQADLLGPGAEVDIRGAAVIGDGRRCHRFLRLRHHVPDGRSRQLLKAVALGTGRSSVDGTVTVDKGAQRTDARQLIQHLLLSKEARADSKPRLLIHADDVKCSHGAAVGKPDPEQQFYLRARGLDSEAAQSLLVRAFLAEALPASGEFGPEAARLESALAGGGT